MRFHILGIPHTVTTPDYTLCAFTQKVVRLCKMLKGAGHTVIHYGHKESEVDCTEHVTVTTEKDMAKAYGKKFNWRKDGLPKFKIDDYVNQKFFNKAILEVGKRKQKSDFLLCMWGSGHRSIADAHPDLLIVEPGIGYPAGHFAPYKVFESYAILHAYLGLGCVATAQNNRWYDVVIPNYFDPSDFQYESEKDDHFLFLGRVGEGKGIHIAIQIAEALNTKLLVAGQGEVRQSMARTDRPINEYVKYIGVVDGEKRKELLSKAKAVLCPSTFVEPFCGVHIEAAMSGTPVIATDFGAFSEYLIHGRTGYRCRTFEQFVWAAKNISTIEPKNCRDWAVDNFSMERVTPMYEEYFHMVQNISIGNGWYQENPERTNLDWLTKYYYPYD